MDTARRNALIAVILGAMTIGLSPIFVRLSDAGPAATGFWRLLFAMPLLIPLALWERRAGGEPRSGFLPIYLLAGALFAGDLGFWHYSIRFTSVTNATVLSNGTPIIVTLAAWLLFRERPRPIFVLGMGLAIAGAVTMTLASAPTVGHGGHVATRFGDGLAVTTALWYGGYFLAVRQARRLAGAGAVMLWSSAVGLPLMLAAAVILGERILPVTPLGWSACVGLGVVHAVGQGAIAWGLGRLPTALAAVVVLVQPVVAAALGWMLFGEAVTPLQAAGAVAALGGVVLAQIASRRATPPEP